jgi:hypothetical protein
LNQNRHNFRHFWRKKNYFRVSDPECLSSSSSSYSSAPFSNYTFFSDTFLTGMTGISLHGAVAPHFYVVWQIGGLKKS